MAERIDKPDFYSLYSAPATPMEKPATDNGQVVRKKERKVDSPSATLLTMAPLSDMENSPFRIALPNPRSRATNVNTGACGLLTDNADSDDVTAPADLRGKMGGQPNTIAELGKDITAKISKIEDDFMQRMAIAMEHAFGNFLNNSRGNIMAMMGEEAQRGVAGT